MYLPTERFRNNESYVHQLRDSEDKLGPVVMQVSWTFEATILQFFFFEWEDVNLRPWYTMVLLGFVVFFFFLAKCIQMLD